MYPRVTGVCLPSMNVHKTTGKLDFFFSFFLGGGTDMAYGGSQARGQNEAVAAGHSHSNARSKPCL